jgi:hypothetical protein
VWCNTPGVWLPCLHLHFISMSIIHFNCAFEFLATWVCNMIFQVCFQIVILWNVSVVTCRCNMGVSYFETWQCW